MDFVSASNIKINSLNKNATSFSVIGYCDSNNLEHVEKFNTKKKNN